MTDRINRQAEAYKTALEYCDILGLDRRYHVIPKVEKKEITGYYIIDGDFCTAVRTVMI